MISLLIVLVMKSLHPNLAKIALRYDEIIEAYQRKEYSEQGAYQLLCGLNARDDNGVLWRINAVSGVWEFKQFSGLWLVGDPPIFGFEGASIDDFNKMNVASNIDMFEVDQENLYPKDQLLGSTNLSRKKSKIKVYSVTNAFILLVFATLGCFVILYSKT